MEGQKRSFSPLSLFSASEQGVWYDPSDITTLFQDAAGTIPVTAVEQPVGLMLDKSKGLVLGPELVVNGDFSAGGTGWVYGSNWNLSGGNASTDGTATTQLWQLVPMIVGKNYKFEADFMFTSGGFGQIYLGGAQSGGLFTSGHVTRYFTCVDQFYDPLVFSLNGGTVCTVDNISIRELPGNHAYQATSAKRPTLSARYNLLTSTSTLSTQSVTTIATSYKLHFEGTGSVELSGSATGIYTAGTYIITCTAGTLTLTISGSVTNADIRVANHGIALPAYQRVNTSTDYDTVGFPKYLAFNGTSSALKTNSIDFSATNKISLFAGARKLSNSTAIIAELSLDINSYAGSFYLVSGYNKTSDGWDITGRGSIGSGVANTSAIQDPGVLSRVISGKMDIPGDTNTIRVNAINGIPATGEQGSGNYGNWPLYIGTRAETSIYFLGYLYGLIVRGVQSTDKQITDTESWINNKIGKVY